MGRKKRHHKPIIIPLEDLHLPRDPDSWKIYHRKAGAHKDKRNKRSKDKERKELESQTSESKE